MQVKIRRSGEDIELPKYDPATSAAFDLAAAEDTLIKPKEIKQIPTGLFIDVPSGYFMGIFSRSSTPARTGLVFPHAVGIIDPQYSGPNDEIRIQVYNITDKEVLVKKGERIAQAMFIEAPKIEWEETQELSTSDRGGFGTTGN